MLGDIGIHILDFCVFAAGVVTDRGVAAGCRPSTRSPGDRIGDYVLDANDSFAMSLSFSNGAIGVIHASRWASGHLNDLKLRVYGEKGGLELTHRLDGTELRVCLGADLRKAAWKPVAAKPVETNYQRFAKAVRAGSSREPDFRHAARSAESARPRHRARTPDTRPRLPFSTGFTTRHHVRGASICRGPIYPLARM